MTRRSAWTLLPAETRVASFEISLGNPRCTGRWLVCLMHWAREHFQHFEFSVGDTLKVYNYMTVGHPDHGRLGSTEAHDIAAAEGRRWFQQNLEAIRVVLAPYDVAVRFWDEWKQQPGFDAAFARLLSLFDSSAVFRDTVLADITDYMRRSGAAALTSADANLLATYVLEEMAVYQLQAEARPTVNLYPGGMLKVLRALGAIPGVPPSLAGRHYAYLDMHERSARLDQPRPFREDITA